MAAVPGVLEGGAGPLLPLLPRLWGGWDHLEGPAQGKVSQVGQYSWVTHFAISKVTIVLMGLFTN